YWEAERIWARCRTEGAKGCERTKPNPLSRTVLGVSRSLAGFSSEERGKGALPLPPPPIPKTGPQRCCVSASSLEKRLREHAYSCLLSPPANQGTFLLWAKVKSFDAAAVG